MRKRSGFTLIELLVAMAVVALLGALLFQVLSMSAETWKSFRNRVSTSQDARLAFQRLQGTLSRAVLNSRLDYANAAGNPRTVGDVNFIPTQVARTSQLQFVSGPASELLPGGSSTMSPGSAVFFQAPMGFTDDPDFSRGQELLNSTGFFVEFGADRSKLPAFLSALPGGMKNRFRLKQWVQPAEKNTIYTSTASTAPGDYFAWFQNSLPSAVGGAAPSGAIPARTLAEDIFAFIALPSTSPAAETAMGGPISSDYRYDSREWAGIGGMTIAGNLKNQDGASVARSSLMRNQLPPFVKIAAFALERPDADRLERQHGTTPPPDLAVPADLFVEATKFDDDVLEFERRLLQNTPPIRARVFRTTVPISSALWSNN